MRIAVFSGPTGGHFFPALAFCHKMKERHPEALLLLVTGERGRPLVKKVKEADRIDFQLVPDFPFPRSRGPAFLLQGVSFLVRLVLAFWKMGWVIGSFRPDVAVGFGSYLSFPGVLLCRRKKIPVLIHEQNRRAGKANRRLARYADRVAVSFEETEGFADHPRVGVTGLPLRKELMQSAVEEEEKQTPRVPPERFRILLLGGSQGSLFLNELAVKTWCLLNDEEKGKVAVIHITGENHLEKVRRAYQELEMESWVAPFHDRMGELYREADLGVTRAGANTLFELAFFGVPNIVVPYPHADGHQEENARFFERQGASICRRESEMTPEKLKQEICSLQGSPETRNRMKENLRRLARPKAADQLARIAEELAGGEQ